VDFVKKIFTGRSFVYLGSGKSDKGFGNKFLYAILAEKLY